MPMDISSWLLSLGTSFCLAPTKPPATNFDSTSACSSSVRRLMYLVSSAVDAPGNPLVLARGMHTVRLNRQRTRQK
ncbi:hypothetical protein V8C86DRAFT_2681052 [Haematococcus lacustris]